jgi:membrane-associated phospholipid phosphatase
MTKLIRDNYPFFIPYLSLLVIGGVLLLTYDKTALFLLATNYFSSHTDVLFRYLTHVGDGLFYLAIAFVLLFVQYRYAILAVSCLIITGLAAQFFKRFVFTTAYRPTRFFENSDIKLRVIEGVEMYSNNSFPSGHATTAFSAFCLLSLLAKNKKWGYLFLFLAFWTSYSRVYLSQHFVGDIYAGSILGVSLTLFISHWAFRYFELEPKKWHQKRLGWKRES